MTDLGAIDIGQHVERTSLHQCRAVGSGIQGMNLPGPGRDNLPHLKIMRDGDERCPGQYHAQRQYLTTLVPGLRHGHGTATCHCTPALPVKDLRVLAAVWDA